MKRFVVLICLLLLSVVPLAAQSSALSRDDINRLSQSVVRIVTIQRGEPIAAGSGTIVDANGLIYTNQHVVEDGDDFAILMLDDPNEAPVLRYYASLIGVSDEIDFALLQIDRDADQQLLESGTLDLPFLTPAIQDMQRGDPIFVFGYPDIGDGYLVFTEGTITTIQNGTINGQRIPAWYQTDAEIAPGNSGGLAVNGDGQLVGIPTAVRMDDRTGGRLGGILPLDAIQAVLDGDRIIAPPQQTTQPDVAASFALEIVNIEHNTLIEGSSQQGMKIYTYIRAAGYMNQNLRVAMFYYWADDRPISGENAAEADRTPSGNLTVQAVLTPQYEDTEWADYWFWLPYAAFPTGLTGTQQAYAQLVIGVEGQEFAAASNRMPFELVYTSSQPNNSLSPVVTQLDYSLAPTYGSASLAAGFTNDPYHVIVTSGGAVDTTYLGNGCNGFAAAAPDFRLNWSGNSAQLRIYFRTDQAGADTTLIINEPDGDWICNDDFDSTTRNPMVILNNPIQGQYDIWVGSYTTGEFLAGELTITERDIRP